MSRTPLHLPFLNWQGTLQKQSSNPILGFQPRFWKILESGTRIGYRLAEQTVFLPDKTYPLASCSVEEVEDETVFLLHTPKRTFKLRAENVVSCKEWMRAVTQLRKNCLRSIKPVSPPHKPLIGNDSTLPSIGIPPTPQPRIRQSTTLNPSHSRRASRISSPLLIGDPPSDLSELIRRMPSSFAYYHILTVKLKRRGENPDHSPHHYILFSSKSLLPEEYISEENLNTSQLPHWAELDLLFRLGEQPHNSRPIFNLAAVDSIEDVHTHCALRIVTAKEVYEFDCEGLEARRKLREVLEVAKGNAVETAGTEGTRNYDALVALHALNLEEFNLKVGLMLAPLLPSEHRFEPKVLPMVVDGLAPLLLGVVQVLQRKQPIPRETIIDFVKLLHEQVRVHLKLVWDTSHSFIKSGQILAILKAVSKYELLANPYVKDAELLDALKELSKLAARACYRQMEPLILTLVSQQRNDTHYLQPSSTQTQEEGLLQTHAVTDLFKLLYEIYGLALPSWNSKLHLHNLHRLVRRCLCVFVTELRALVDEEDLSPPQLAALANDYLRFSEEVDTFYEDRLSDLQEQTREHYSQLRDDYREVSLLVVEKLLLPLRLKLRLHFEQQIFFAAALEHPYKLIALSPLKQLLPNLHPIFQKRCLEALFALLTEEICRLLEKEAVGKKKPPLEKVLTRLEALRKDLVEMRQLLGKLPLKAEKALSELAQLLATTRKEQAKLMLSQLPEKTRKSYLKILNLRADYTPGSPFFTFLQTLQDAQLAPSPSSSSPRRRSSLPKAYLQQWQRASITSLDQQQQKPQKQPKQQEKIKMISQGWVIRGRSGTSEERIYLRLKRAVLYIYADNQSERCQNTLQIEDITEISHPHPDRPLFTIRAKVLGRNKEMKLQCPQWEDAARWVFSLQGEMRRVGNDRKMKWKGLKGKEKRSKLVIDYAEAETGPDYFSYAE